MYNRLWLGPAGCSCCASVHLLNLRTAVPLLLLCVVFVYAQVPPRMQHDPYVLVLILVLWLAGGYIK
jgi:hypothetical protein